MELLTPEYKQQITQKHLVSPWGGDGWRWIPHVARVIVQHRLKGNPTVLDYGCGRSTFRDTMKWAMPHVRVSEYDPGVEGKDRLPDKQARFDIVLCTDVMEHVEEQFVSQTLERLRRYTDAVSVINISTIPSRSTLPDGRNAHVTVKPPEWWAARLDLFWSEVKVLETGKAFTVYATP